MEFRKNAHFLWKGEKRGPCCRPSARAGCTALLPRCWLCSAALKGVPSTPKLYLSSGCSWVGAGGMWEMGCRTWDAGCGMLDIERRM